MTRHVGSGYAKYIGRVGALAVALGVAGAVATTPGVAWADDTASTSSTNSEASESDQDSPPSGDKSTTTSGSSPTSSGQTPSNSSADPSDEPDEASDEPSEPTESPETETTGENGSAGGADTAGDDEIVEDTADGETEIESEEPISEAPDTDDPDAAPVLEESADGDGVDPDTQPLVTVHPEATSEQDDTTLQSQSAEDTETVALFHATADAIDHRANPIAAALPKLPTPDEVVQQIQAAVTTCLCGVVNTAFSLISALTGGGAAAGSGGPAAPFESPMLLGVLEFARREINRAVEAFSHTPIAQFAHQITTRITQEVKDFGNSPLGRRISSEFFQTLLQCQPAATLPDDLERLTVVSGLTEPTDFAYLTGDGTPDQIHRIFITEKSGAIKVYNPNDGTVTTLMSLPTITADGERGLLGIEVDPQFWTQNAEGYHTIYVAFTDTDNLDTLARIRVTTSLDGATIDNTFKSTELGNNFHHGGELLFDREGKYLYWAVGDNTDSRNSQLLTNIHGKILRLNRDFSAPEDNPYYNTPGAVKQIYAIGFRNPFRLAFTPNDKLLAADVGEASWEELNVVTPGGNYGWPAQEGSCTGCEYINPIYAYQHSAPPANAGSITAVMVYSGDSLPENYRNKVYIADYSVGWMKELEFDEQFTSLISERMLDSQAGTTVKLAQGPDGNIYQLNIYPGRLSVIVPSGGNRAPTAAITASATYGLGDSLDVQFSAAGSSDPEGDDLTYQWNFGNGQTSTEESPTITFTNTGEYTAYTVTLAVSDGEEVSTATQRIVVGSTPPTASIDDMDSTYDAGDTITFTGTGDDDEDAPGVQTLPASAYKWTVVFHHAEHVHPFRDDIVGPTGSITIPRTPDQLANTFYRITLTVTDSSGLSTTTYKDIKPNVVDLTFNASHPDAKFTIDGRVHEGFYTEKAVVGVERVLGAPSMQFVDDGRLDFLSWSDGGTPTHTIITPGANTSYTVTYDLIPSEAAALT